MPLPRPSKEKVERMERLAAVSRRDPMTREQKVLETVVDEQKMTTDKLGELVNLTKRMLDSQRELFGKMVTAMDAKSEKTTAKDVSGAVKQNDNPFKGLKGSMGGFGFMTLFIPAAIAWVTGIDQYIRLVVLPKTLKTISPLLKAGFIIKPIETVVMGIGKIISGEVGKTSGLVRTMFAERVISPITRAANDFISGFQRVGKTIGSVMSPVKVREFNTLFGKMGAILSKMVGIVRRIGNFFSPLIKGLEFLAKMFNPIIEVVKNIRGHLGPLAKVLRFARVILGPFTMIMFGIFDFLKGFIKGFEEGGLIEGLKEGALELIRGFITKPLDLFKDIISWIVGKLGFENFSKQLDSFSFTGLFDNLIDQIGNIWQLMKDWISEQVDSIKSFVRKIPGIGNLIAGDEPETRADARERVERTNKARAVARGNAMDRNEKLKEQLAEAMNEAETGTSMFGDEAYRERQAERADMFRKLIKANETIMAQPNVVLPEPAISADAENGLNTEKEKSDIKKPVGTGLVGRVEPTKIENMIHRETGVTERGRMMTQASRETAAAQRVIAPTVVAPNNSQTSFQSNRIQNNNIHPGMPSPRKESGADRFNPYHR